MDRVTPAVLSALLDRLPDLVTVLDAGGVIRFWSAAGGPLLGYSPDELIGTTAVSLIHPEDRARVENFLAQAATRGAGTPAPSSCASAIAMGRGGRSRRCPPTCLMIPMYAAWSPSHAM
jgi:PAS domain-containing protein